MISQSSSAQNSSYGLAGGVFRSDSIRSGRSSTTADSSRSSATSVDSSQASHEGTSIMVAAVDSATYQKTPQKEGGCGHETGVWADPPTVHRWDRQRMTPRIIGDDTRGGLAEPRSSPLTGDNARRTFGREAGRKHTEGLHKFSTAPGFLPASRPAGVCFRVLREVAGGKTPPPLVRSRVPHAARRCRKWPRSGTRPLR